MLKYKEAILYAILIILGFVFLMTKIGPKVIDIVKIQIQIRQKNTEIESLTKEIKQIEEYEKLKKESVTKLKRIYVPEEQADTIENSFAVMLDDIINITKYNNIKVFSIQYTYNPKDDEFVSKAGDQYDACSIDLELIADYKNFESMLIELIKYPYFLKINSFKIIPYQKDKKILLIQLKLTLYVEKTGAEKNAAKAQAKQETEQQKQEQTAQPSPAQGFNSTPNNTQQPMQQPVQ